MKQLSLIGLDAEKSIELAGMLNDLLANYSIFYQNVRGYHWNIRGEKFFELHQKFQDLYNDLLIKIDDLAERILALGQTPFHRYSDFLSIANIKESHDVTNGLHAVDHILETYQTILTKQRDILRLASEIGDEGTGALMSDYIREQEKSVWMYSAYLNK